MWTACTVPTLNRCLVLHSCTETRHHSIFYSWHILQCFAFVSVSVFRCWRSRLFSWKSCKNSRAGQSSVTLCCRLEVWHKVHLLINLFFHLSLRLLYFLHPVQVCLCRCTAVCCLPSVLGSVGLCHPCHHPGTDRGDWLKSKPWRPVRCSVWSVCCTQVSWMRTKRKSYQQPANSASTYLSKYQRRRQLSETHRRSAWKRWWRESVKPRLFLLNVKTPKRPLKVLIWSGRRHGGLIRALHIHRWLWHHPGYTSKHPG